MKKWIIRRVFLVIISGLLILPLSACGETKNISGTKNNETIFAKEAFEQKGIWFHSGNGVVEKDKKIKAILIFDGNGNVTHYRTNITFADLRGRSQEGIIELAKEQDKALFEEAMQKYISLAKDADISMYSYSFDSEEEYREYLDKQISIFTEMPYQEPEAYPFALKIETDGSGNNTSKETLIYSYRTWDTTIFEIDGATLSMDKLLSWEGYYEKKGEIELYPVFGNMIVYDMQFNGFSELSLQVEEGHAGFVLDTPDTEGIEVD